MGMWGQGQMLTYSELKTCVHFDMGGEFFPIKKLIKECGAKKNKVFFSHWDWDHINFTKKAFRRLPSFCRLNNPGGEGSEKKKRFLSAIPFCSKKSLADTQKTFREITFPAYKNKKLRDTKANKYSRGGGAQKQGSYSGGFPRLFRKALGKKIKSPITILVAGHHGSRYSTTPQLLQYLPYLKTAIASSRRKRYNHPHPLLKKRLAKKGVTLLSTEEFNHIFIPLN